MCILFPAVYSVLRTLSGTQKVLDKHVSSEWMAMGGKELGIFGQ